MERTSSDLTLAGIVLLLRDGLRLNRTDSDRWRTAWDIIYLDAEFFSRIRRRSEIRKTEKEGKTALRQIRIQTDIRKITEGLIVLWKRKVH
jgi:hypothetical protein